LRAVFFFAVLFRALLLRVFGRLMVGFADGVPRSAAASDAVPAANRV
jgi:hypothetical protein